MNEAEIVKKWENDRPVYQAWGDVVLGEIESSLAMRIDPMSLTEFLKVPATPRLKNANSLVDKALYRNKDYLNPYDDITDKVGLRFVVLLTSDIKIIEEIICASKTWRFSKDRDYEKEREDKPMEFSYQSVHYVVKAAHEIIINGNKIPMETPCEIQVRTLLQHAHCELTHGSIYKSKKTAPLGIQRTVAKSMALIEATDEFFERVVTDLSQATAPEREALSALEELYKSTLGLIPEGQKSNQLIIDAFSDRLGNDLEKRLAKFVKEKPFVATKISERAVNGHLYRQSAIFFIYFMAASSPAVTKENWPFTQDDLRTIYSDLGMSLDNY